MSDFNYADEVETVASHLLSKSPSTTFKKYWELYKDTAYLAAPKGIYFRSSQDATYRNLVIAGQTGIVDIETEEASLECGLVFTPYSTISGVILRMGFIPSLPHTEDSLLTVICRVSGTTSLGNYWYAQDEPEANRLRTFAKILINEVSLQKRTGP